MQIPRPLHITTLRKMARSPAHLRAAIEQPQKPTSAMRNGSLGHAVVLGGKYTVFDRERRGNLWAEFKAEHEGELIVTRAELDHAQRARDAIFAHPIAGPLLSVGQREQPVEWEMYGEQFATRGIDLVSQDNVVELKFASTVQPTQFQWACLKMAYHAQVSSYMAAARSLNVEPSEGWIVGVEPLPPYAITVFHLTPRALVAGEKLVRLWTERLLACEAADAWPSYCESAIDLDVDDQPANLLIDGDEVEAA